jgi:hypothetical protein
MTDVWKEKVSSSPARSLEELLQGATELVPLVGSDGKSGALMERVVIGGESYVLKHISFRQDWTMRVTGDYIGRPLLVWESGLLGELPPCVDHAMVRVGRWPGGGAILMRDVGPYLVPEGNAPLPIEQHLRFLDHMAQLHARFWDGLTASA